MGEKNNKTKVLLKGLHLAYVNSELVTLFRKDFSIVNYVAWVKEQADLDFGFQLETKEDIQKLQKRIEMHGFDTIGEWLDCVMREKLGLWPTNKKLKEEIMKNNATKKYSVSMSSLAPWEMNDLSTEAEAQLRALLNADGDFELKGGIENGGDITMSVFSAGDAISVHAIYGGRRGSVAAVANKALPRTASYEQVLALMQEKKRTLVSALRDRCVIYDHNGFVTDREDIETDDVAVLAEKASGMIAHSSLEKLYPEVEDTIEHLLSMEKDGRPVDFEVVGYAKNREDVTLTIKADGDHILVRVDYNGTYDAEREETLARSASFWEIRNTAITLFDDIFLNGYEET